MMTRRLENLRNYCYLAARFRNSPQLIRAYRDGPPCETAVLWNGTQLTHPPGRGGLVGTILDQDPGSGTSVPVGTDILVDVYIAETP